MKKIILTIALLTITGSALAETIMPWSIPPPRKHGRDVAIEIQRESNDRQNQLMEERNQIEQQRLMNEQQAEVNRQQQAEFERVNRVTRTGN